MTELTNIQKFMIGKIKEEITKTNKALKSAQDVSEKFKLKKKLENLKEQLANAQKPFERTEKEKELINKMAENVKKNAEVTSGVKIEGDRSDKPLTSKEEFEHGMSMFIQEVEHRREQLLKDMSTQEGIIKLLENHEPVGDEDAYKAEIAARKNIYKQMQMSLELFDDRIREKDEVQKWALDNYEFISRLNIWLNNPLRLKDYEDYEENIKSKYNKGE